MNRRACLYTAIMFYSYIQRR